METTGTNRPIRDPDTAAALARALHERPGEFIGRDPVPVLSFEPGASLRDRREALGPVYGAIVARTGEPTLRGGSARGPDVRWRDARRTVLLSGAGPWALLSVHDTAALEAAERRSFDWGGAWSRDEPHDPGLLPYLWRLDRGGPGEPPADYPAGCPLPGLDHFASALELLLAAWVEQLPVQVGDDWAAFTLTSSADRGRRFQLSYARRDGLLVSVDDRDGEDSPERGLLMRARGWHCRDRGWWQSEFPDPDRSQAAEAARTVLTELRARGTAAPDQLRARDASCRDRGTLLLPGLGIRT
ncbi:hypothetical protein ACWDR0_17045 [Streptomyces sp. NPDC003691]